MLEQLAASSFVIEGHTNRYDNFVRFSISQAKLPSGHPVHQNVAVLFENGNKYIELESDWALPLHHSYLLNNISMTDKSSGVYAIEDGDYITIDKKMAERNCSLINAVYIGISTYEEIRNDKRSVCDLRISTPCKLASDTRSFIDIMEETATDSSIIVLHATGTSMFYFVLHNFQDLAVLQRHLLDGKCNELKYRTMNELIRRNKPIKLYFDIDHDNHSGNGSFAQIVPTLLLYFVDFVNRHLAETFQKTATEPGSQTNTNENAFCDDFLMLDKMTVHDWIFLEANSARKTSYHIIHPTVFFKDVEQLKIYINSLIDYILESTTPLCRLFTKTRRGDGSRDVFFDTAVYKSGAGFRMFGAVKKTEPDRPLVPSHVVGDLVHPMSNDVALLALSLLHYIPDKDRCIFLDISRVAQTGSSRLPGTSRPVSVAGINRTVSKNNTVAIDNNGTAWPRMCAWIAEICSSFDVNKHKYSLTLSEISQKLKLFKREGNNSTYCVPLSNARQCPIGNESHNSSSQYLLLTISINKNGVSVYLYNKCKKASCDGKRFTVYVGSYLYSRSREDDYPSIDFNKLSK